MLLFAQQFHEATFEEEAGEEILSHLERDAQTGGNDLSYVNIHSATDLVMWGDMQPEIVSEVQYYIAEISDYYDALVLEYVISDDTMGVELTYEVQEYYRIRVGNNAIYLLDFERTMEQIYTTETAVFEDGFVKLGIANDDETEYLGNQYGTILAYVASGELWLYDQNAGEVIKVFGFRTDDYSDIRSCNMDHEIHILSVDESGNTEFVVCGYMARGDHEGEVGIGVYRYNRDENTVEEELFLRDNKEASVVIRNTSNLFYVNAKNNFYLMLDGVLYRIDMLSQTATVVREGLAQDSFLVSEGGRYIAWIDEAESYSSETIYMMDMETEEILEITGQEGQYLMPLMYRGDDFVYGIANATDVVTDAAGNVTFAMESVRILDENQDLIKEYSAAGYYILSVYSEGDVMHVVRVTKDSDSYEEVEIAADAEEEEDAFAGVTTSEQAGEEAADTADASATTVTRNYTGGYVLADEDTIVSYDVEGTEFNKSQTLNLDYTGMICVAITMADATETAPTFADARFTVVEGRDTLTLLGDKELTDYYLVYRACDCVLSVKHAATAVTLADEEGGVVIGVGQAYMWRRGKQTSINIGTLTYPTSAQTAGSSAQCVDAILDYEEISNNAEFYLNQGYDVFSTMKATLSEHCVLDLGGCTLDEVLYYVAQGTPVLAMASRTDAVLLVGYDATNVVIFYPADMSTARMTLTEAAELFASVGNVYVGYVRT